jgi:hypothetical protein
MGRKVRGLIFGLGGGVSPPSTSNVIELAGKVALKPVAVTVWSASFTTALRFAVL